MCLSPLPLASPACRLPLVLCAAFRSWLRPPATLCCIVPPVQGLELAAQRWLPASLVHRRLAPVLGMGSLPLLWTVCLGWVVGLWPLRRPFCALCALQGCLLPPLLGFLCPLVLLLLQLCL